MNILHSNEPIVFDPDTGTEILPPPSALDKVRTFIRNLLGSKSDKVYAPNRESVFPESQVRNMFGPGDFAPVPKTEEGEPVDEDEVRPAASSNASATVLARPARRDAETEVASIFDAPQRRMPDVPRVFRNPRPTHRGR